MLFLEQNKSSNNLKELDKLITANKIISHCSNETKNILFTINNQESTINDLIQEFNLRAELSLSLKNINYTINKNIENNIILKPQIINYLLDVYSEILNNIIKHSQATNIVILINYSNKKLILKVSDNGIGFNYLEQRSKKHTYGFDILERLSKEINSIISINSYPEIGTIIEIVISI
ncbi:MAG: ATP-binding protein [Spirochaetota bacterium]|nr:ATP-binding protein [Spirochaetota bacterium]